MIEVEAAQKILVRLPVAGVLRDDQAGHDFEDLAGSKQRPVLELLMQHAAFAGRAGDAGERDAVGRDDDFFETGGGHPAGERLSRRESERAARQKSSAHEDAPFP